MKLVFLEVGKDTYIFMIQELKLVKWFATIFIGCSSGL